MHQVDQNQTTYHIPVLLEAVLKYLDPKPGESYLDATAGYGGHAKAVLDRTFHKQAVLIDRDHEAVKVLKNTFGSEAEIIHQDFCSASADQLKLGRRFDMILADLGVSSPHLNIASRGFSIRAQGPLDMRMDTRQKVTAETIVNSYSQEQLESIIQRYGEEPRYKAIAGLIIRNRPIGSTTQLADIVSQAWPGRSRVHPATRTFQAIRIAVNDELDQIQNALLSWKTLLAPGGRLVVISFHSLEDRLVKQFFNEFGGPRYDSELKLLTKQPVVAEPHEIVHNPRARSAKLRAAVKINT